MKKKNLKRDNLIAQFKQFGWTVEEDRIVPIATSPSGGIKVTLYHEQVAVKFCLGSDTNVAEFLTKTIDTLPLVKQNTIKLNHE